MKLAFLAMLSPLHLKKMVLIWLFWTSNVDFEYLKVYEKSVS